MPMPRRPLLATLGALLASACSPVSVLNAMAPRDGVQAATDLTYAAGGRGGVDVYAPADARDAPVVMFLYGGGWEAGERGMYRFVGASLAAGGVVCMIPDYRVYPEVRFPAFVEDAARAVAWGHAHAAEHGGSPERMMLMGHSAGAHIAAMLALNPVFLRGEGLDPAMLKGVIGLAGPYDFLPLRTRQLRAIFGTEAQWPASQPVNFVTPGAPPMLLATGNQDSVVLPRNSESLAAAMLRVAAPVRSIVYPGLGHSEVVGALGRPFRFVAPVRADVLRFVAERAAA